jgi:DNA repair photolyase
LARKLEPRAAAPYRRLKTIAALSQAGVPVGVSLSPQIPFLNDDMEKVLRAASDAGARAAFYSIVRLPWELDTLFFEWLVVHYPERKARIISRIRDMRDGKNYQSDFATRGKGTGVWSDLIHQRFDQTCRRLGLSQKRIELDFTKFCVPSSQQSLF